jgi:hypothetical protein
VTCPGRALSARARKQGRGRARRFPNQASSPLAIQDVTTSTPSGHQRTPGDWHTGSRCKRYCSHSCSALRGSWRSLGPGLGLPAPKSFRPRWASERCSVSRRPGSRSRLPRRALAPPDRVAARGRHSADRIVMIPPCRGGSADDCARLSVRSHVMRCTRRCTEPKRATPERRANATTTRERVAATHRNGAGAAAANRRCSCPD